jgi:hypothetical protein
VRSALRPGLATAIVVVCLLPLLLAHTAGPLKAGGAWGLALIVSFAGWGAWLRRRLVPQLDVDWGLRIAWGLALTVAVGGVLCLTTLARRPLLLAWVFAGVALAAREALLLDPALADKLRRPWRLVPRRWDTPVVAALLAVVGLLYAGAAGRAIANPSDDWVAYLPFINMILDTGTLIDPFSVRRMAAYGGQSYLQTLARLGSDDAQVHLFDQGMGLLVLVALVLGSAREAPAASRVLRLVLLVVIVMLPEVRINTTSELSGVVGFVALARTMTLVDRAELRGARAGLLVALPAAFVCTLRQNYLLVAGFMLAALLLRGGETWHVRRRAALTAAALTAACLAPWAALAIRSNNTFLFPFVPGNYDPSYAALTAPATWAARVAVYLSAAFHDEPIRSMPLLLIAAPAVARACHRRSLLGLWAGTIVGFAVLALSLPDADNFTLSRYGFAPIVAFALVTGLAAAEHLPHPGWRPDFAVLGLVLVAFAVQIKGTHTVAAKKLTAAYERARGDDPNRPPLPAGREEVRRMQQAVPAGERMLVMIERPYLLDYARNRITHIDLPGAASPPPRMPLAGGGDKVAAYLLSQEIRYFAFVRPERAQSEIYSRTHWTRLLTGRARIWRITAPLFLSTFDAVAQLASTRRRLHDDGHLVVVDLAQGAQAASWGDAQPPAPK